MNGIRKLCLVTLQQRRQSRNVRIKEPHQLARITVCHLGVIYYRVARILFLGLADNLLPTCKLFSIDTIPIRNDIFIHSTSSILYYKQLVNNVISTRRPSRSHCRVILIQHGYPIGVETIYDNVRKWPLPMNQTSTAQTTLAAHPSNLKIGTFASFEHSDYLDQ